MALEYKLICRCFKDGKFKTQPPHPEFLQQDGSGEYYFDYPEDSSVYADSDEAAAAQQNAIMNANRQWQSKICAHNERRGSLYGFSRQMGINFVLTTYLSGDWERFPTLDEYYPLNNEGSLPLKHAPAFIAELKKLAFDTKIPSVIVQFDKLGETDIAKTFRQDGALLTQLESDGTFGLYAKEGFYIVQISQRQTYEDLKARIFGYSAAEMLAHPDAVVLFHSNEFFKANTSGQYVYSDEKNKAYYACHFNYLRQMFSGEELNDGTYRWEMDEYDFEEYRDTFERLIEIVEAAIQQQCDVEWY